MTDTNSMVPSTNPSDFCAPSRRTAGELSEIYNTVIHESVRLHNLRSPESGLDSGKENMSVEDQRRLCIELGTTAFHLRNTMRDLSVQMGTSPDTQKQYHSQLHEAWKLRHKFSASDVLKDIKDAFEDIESIRDDTYTALLQSLVPPEAPPVCSKKARAYFEPQESGKPKRRSSNWSELIKS